MIKKVSEGYIVQDKNGKQVGGPYATRAQAKRKDKRIKKDNPGR